MQSNVMQVFKSIASTLLTVFIALMISAILIVITGNNPIEAYELMLNGALGSAHKVSETLVKAVPLMIMAFGTSIAFKNKIWNIGADGQFTLGAIFSIIVGIYTQLPPFLLIPIAMILSFIGGGLWAGIAGWLKTKFNANEVITTLMLNYIATYFLTYLVYGPMMDPAGYGFPQTPLIPEASRLALFSQDTRIHTGSFIAIALIVVMVLFWRSNLGYRIELMGQGDQVARYAGVNAKRTLILAIFLSGGLAGLAGFNEVYGVHYRLMTEISSGYGSLAIVIALLGNLNPIGIAISSFFFSVLLVGGNTMQRMTDIPYSIVNVIQGLVIIFVITRESLRFDSVKKCFDKIRGNKNA